MPGLDKYIQGKKGGATSNETKQNQSPQRGERDDRIVVNTDPTNREKVDKEADKKCCPRCLTVGGRDKVNGWECPNDNCGTLAYRMGYKEWRQLRWRKDGFLMSVDLVQAMESFVESKNDN